MPGGFARRCRGRGAREGNSEQEQPPTPAKVLLVHLSRIAHVSTARVVHPPRRPHARQVQSSGAHWIYFHPYCDGWESGRLVQEDQRGVLEGIDLCAGQFGDGFLVRHFPDRYREDPVCFDGYHACHFLMVVGADGRNYLSTELKYQPESAVADLNGGFARDHLWRSSRLRLIAAAHSGAYPATAARHRGVLYSDLLTGLIRGRPEALEAARRARDLAYAFPQIL